MVREKENKEKGKRSREHQRNERERERKGKPAVMACSQLTGGKSVLQLCGCYLSWGGSEQIGANGTAGVCLMSQHAAEAWELQRRLS